MDSVAPPRLPQTGAERPVRTAPGTRRKSHRPPRKTRKDSGDPAHIAEVHIKRVRIPARVLVLNATYEPINVCTVRRAIVLMLKGRAEVIEQYDRELHAENFTMTQPAVIRLVSYVKLPLNRFSRKITRRAIFARDDWECQYCGQGGTLTVDHVIPRSKGGGTSWENVVASCAPCNRRKGDKLPAQANMHPRIEPRQPKATIFIHVASPTIPSAWQQYLLAA